MKRLTAFVTTLIGGWMWMHSAQAAALSGASAWDFSFPMPEGRELALKDLQGKVLLVVNTASQCGFTPQYKALQELYTTYQDRGLVVIAVPSNDFGQQEPGTAEEIQAFTQDQFNIRFPVTEKQVVSGKHAHPFYLWVNRQAGAFGSPKWNFHKYLIGRDGQLKEWFATTTQPLDASVIKAIESELQAGAPLSTPSPALSSPEPAIEQ